MMASGSAPLPPSPSHLLRSHSTQLSALAISDDNERLYSGDVSGLVVITSTRSLRAIASWKAHTNGLLGVEEWVNGIITFANPLPLQCRDLYSQASSLSNGRYSGMEETINYMYGHAYKNLSPLLPSVSEAPLPYQDFQSRRFVIPWM
jgi:hypothetical protein